MRKTWSLVAQTSGARIYWALGTLVTTIITTRYLGPEGRGVYVAAIGWAMMFGTFGHLSLAQVTIYVVAGKPREEWLDGLLGSLLTILGAVTLITWAIGGALYAASDGEIFNHLDAGVVILAFAIFPTLLWIEGGAGVLMALGKLPVMNGALIVGATATLALTFVAVRALGFGVEGALTATLIAQAVAVAISLGHLLKNVPEMHVNRDMMRQLLAGGVKLHLNAIGTYLFTQANVLILNHYRTPSETAYYQLAVQLVTGLQIIPASVGAVAYSLVSRMGPDAAWPQQRKLLIRVTGLVVALAVIAYFVAPWIIPRIFGAPFAAAVPVFRILLLGSVGWCISIVMASQWISRGLFVQAALLTVLFGSCTVIGNFVAVPRYGMYGAAWVSVATYALSIIGNGIMALWVESRAKKFSEEVAAAAS